MGIISGIADQNNIMFFFISSEPVGTHVLFEELGKVVLVTIVLLARAYCSRHRTIIYI